MTYEEELRDGGRYFGDPLARADWLRDQLRDSSSCFTCGSLDPAIIEGRYCSDCTGEWRQGFIDTRFARLVRENVDA